MPNGRHVLCGHAGGLIPHDPHFYIAQPHARRRRPSAATAATRCAASTRSRTPRSRVLLDAGKFRPQVTQSVAFADVPDAVTDLAERRTMGRVVVRVPKLRNERPRPRDPPARGPGVLRARRGARLPPHRHRHRRPPRHAATRRALGGVRGAAQRLLDLHLPGVRHHRGRRRASSGPASRAAPRTRRCRASGSPRHRRRAARRRPRRSPTR